MVSSIKKILVVEDEEDIIELICEIFDDIVSYETLYARDGEEALRIARTNNPDIILLDIHLPKMNGYQLCKFIKSDAIMSQAKIIMLSGMTQNCDILQAQQAGADDYIAKPFTSTVLVKKIDALLKND